jgi:competence protein ComEC
MPDIVFGNEPETILYSAASKSSRKLNHVLMGTYLIARETDGDWFWVTTRSAGRGGWVHKDEVRDNPGLKAFYVDVGQGNGAIIESPQEIILMDGGPNTKYHHFLRWRYRGLIAENGSVKIKAMVISHPDQDHYQGFTAVLEDPAFEVEAIYHNGIIRYPSNNVPAHLDFDLGDLSTSMIAGQKETILTETFSTIENARDMLATGHHLSKKGNKTVFHKFWEAAVNAHDAGRVGKAKRLTVRNKTLSGFSAKDDDKLFIEILGPTPTKMSGSIAYVTFPEAEDIVLEREDPEKIPRASSSHTRNGHSIVLKLHFGNHSFLFGGDLNIPAQLHLMKHYADATSGDTNPFRCDVAKACHHGSSDFHVDFLKEVRPRANVISSGDNKSFDHPVADAVGALCRQTRGDFPLFFSTELARATSGDKTHYGLINARSNGTVLTMAQMKEQHKNKADVWDSFTEPWKGKFHDVLSNEHTTSRLS